MNRAHRGQDGLVTVSSERIRVAAAGDVHASDAERQRLEEAFAGLAGDADLVLLAGDLTAYGHPEQARVLADACREVDVPVLAVLGNHDWHLNRRNEIADVLRDGGVMLLDRSST